MWTVNILLVIVLTPSFPGSPPDTSSATLLSPPGAQQANIIDADEDGDEVFLETMECEPPKKRGRIAMETSDEVIIGFRMFLLFPYSTFAGRLR